MKNPDFKYVEQWNNLPRWYPGNANAFSTNRLYSGGTTILDPAGGNYPLNIAAGDRLHVRATLTLVTPGGQFVAIGLTQAVGNTVSGSSANFKSVLWGISTEKVARYSYGAGYPATANLNNIAGIQPNLPGGTYQLSLIVDDTHVTFSLTNAAHSVHYTDTQLRTAFNGNPSFTGVMMWNSDTRFTAGSYLGPMDIEFTKAPSALPVAIGDSVHQVPVNGQSAMVTVPASYDEDTATPLAIYVHGAGGNDTSVWGEPNLPAVVSALTNAGYMVASSNVHGDNWGNQSAVDDIYAMYQYLDAHYNVGKVVVLSHSMGGLAGLLTIKDGRIPNIKGWAGIYPVTNLADLYAAGIYTNQIKTAYNIPAGGTYAVQTVEHDPNLLTASTLHNLPMRFYASSGDTTVSKANNSDALSTIMSTGTSPEYAVVACTGNHGDPSHFQPSDVLSFFNRCLSY